jgi:hypothetical protein
VITYLMIYCMAVSLLTGLAGFALERLAAWRGWKRRTIWAFALGMAIVLPMMRAIGALDAPAPLSHSDPAPTRSASVDAPVVLLARVADGAVISDKTLALGWAVSSSSMVLYYLLVAGRMRRNARAWQPTNIDGQRVWITDAVGPAVYGFIRPRILLPRWIIESPARSRTPVLDHEREHVKANDNLLLLFGLLVLAAAPWNIPLWWQFRRLRFALEVDCDARVMARGLDPHTYARALLSVAEKHSHNPVGAVGLTKPASQLMQRVRIMTTVQGRPSLWAVCGVLGSSLACVTMAAQLNLPSAPVYVEYPGTGGKSSNAASVERPDVVFQVVFMKDGEYLASPTVVGKFGQEVRVEIPKVMRVYTVAAAPNREGLSLTSAKMAIYQDNAWQTPKEMTMQAHLSMTPSFEYSVPDTPYRFVVMPRSIVPAANQKGSEATL